MINVRARARSPYVLYKAASSQEAIDQFPEQKTIVYGSKKRLRRTLETSAS
jgi:hypothetical protein